MVTTASLSAVRRASVDTADVDVLSTSASVTSNIPSTFGFDGVASLSAYGSATRDGGAALQLSPPDSCICTGNGFILESINQEVGFRFADSLEKIGEDQSLSTFFGYEPLDENFLFDPVCVYDDVRDRFIFLVANSVSPNSTTEGDYTKLNIAVSLSGDPRDGFHTFNYLKSSYFADFPHIGIDADAVFITYNNFSLTTDDFVGAGICGLSLNKLIESTDAGADENSLPQVCLYLWEMLPEGKECVSSVSPTRNYMPNDNETYTRLNGVHYFISVDCTGPQNMDVIAVTNTLSLNSDSPQLFAQWVTIDLGYVKYNPYGYDWPNKASANQPVYYTDNGDGRSADATFFNNTIIGCFSNVMSDGKSDIVALSYVFIPVSWDGLFLDLSNFDGARDGGAIGLAGSNLVFPIVTVTDIGTAVFGFAILGMTYYPSAAFCVFNPAATRQAIYISGVGKTALSGTQAQPWRYGDYSSAYSDGKVVYLYSEFVQTEVGDYDVQLKYNYEMFVTKLNLTHFDWDDVPSSSSSSDSNDDDKTAYIAGGVVGGAAVVAIVVFLYYWCVIRKQSGSLKESLSPTSSAA